jgi:beta-glucanase (GH16 family)
MLRLITDNFHKMPLRFKNALNESWQLLICIAFVFMALFALNFSFVRSESVQAIFSTVNTTARALMRTKVDTSKPWTYNFATQPDGALDPKYWNIENGPTKANYNNELQTFADRTDNVRVEDGALVLEALPGNRDNKAYTSGRVDTNGSFNFLYGTLEVDAKLPRGVGTWPAAWLIPSNPRYKAADFKSATDQARLWTLNGELDFLESVGYLPGRNIPAAHSYNSLGRNPIYTPGIIANPYDEYHRYGIIKTPTSIQFTIDGVTYARRDKTSDDPLEWPFDQPYYLVMNLSLGGQWAGKYGVDNSLAPWKFSVRSITYTPASK